MSILNVIRPDEPSGWDPVTDATSDKERIMYQVLITGPVFDTDNKRVWDELKKRTTTSNAFEWIKTYEATEVSLTWQNISLCNKPHLAARLTWRQISLGSESHLAVSLTRQRF